ncbi:hypothetical protein HK405_015345, partial [Cladochytrium tenue]
DELDSVMDDAEFLSDDDDIVSEMGEDRFRRTGWQQEQPWNEVDEDRQARFVASSLMPGPERIYRKVFLARHRDENVEIRALRRAAMDVTAGDAAALTEEDRASIMALMSSDEVRLPIDESESEDYDLVNGAFGQISDGPGSEPHPMWATGWIYPFSQDAWAPRSWFAPTLRLLLENTPEARERRRRFFVRLHEWRHNLPLPPHPSLLTPTSDPVHMTAVVLALAGEFCNAPLPFGASRPWPADWDQFTIGARTDEGSAMDVLPADDLQKPFIVTGRGWPLQWTDSGATTTHFQTARSLCLGPLTYATFWKATGSGGGGEESRIWIQRPWTLNRGHLSRGGSNDLHDCRRALVRLLRTRRQAVARSLGGVVAVEDSPARSIAGLGVGCPFGIVTSPDVCSYTQYMPESLAVDGGVLHTGIRLAGSPLCVDYAYGYLAVGYTDGTLTAFCMKDSK